jgi:hypothetical protein
MIREVDVDYDGRMNYEGMYKLEKTMFYPVWKQFTEEDF